MKITIDHMHSVPTWNGRQGFCHGQARAFARRHDLDWMAFLRDGIDAQVLLDTQDALAIYLVDYVKRLVDGQQ